MNLYKTFIGKKYNKLTIISVYGRNKHYHVLMNCLCSCGNKNVKIVKLDNLRNNTTKSCGCHKKEITTKNAKKNFTKHDFSKTSFYSIWTGIKQRCNNKNKKSYKDYGGRGITYDPRWNDFLEFKKDMWRSYIYASKKYRKILTKNNPLSIERKDVNGNYCKENCCWIPLNEQWENTRNIKLFKAISPDGKEYTSNNQLEFSKEHNLNYTCVNGCLNGYQKTHIGWVFKYLK